MSRGLGDVYKRQAELRGLAGRYEDFKASRVEVVAVSADSPENHKALGLPFPVLSDPDLKVITEYGLLHPKGYMGRDVARPTTLLIAKGSREIQWLSAADDVRVRPPVDEVVEALRK